MNYDITNMTISKSSHRHGYLISGEVDGTPVTAITTDGEAYDYFHEQEYFLEEDYARHNDARKHCELMLESVYERQLVDDAHVEFIYNN